MDKLNRRRFLAFAAALSAVPTAHATQAGLGLDLLPAPDADDGLTFRVLAIHDVRDDLHTDVGTVADTCAISTATLHMIFAWLKAKDFRPVSVDQIIASRNGGPRLPPRAVLLTFDDAYSSQYTRAFPLLRQYDYPALIGVVTRWTDTPAGEPVRISHKSVMPPGYFMSWDNLREMADSGLVEIASHTHDLHHGALANPQGNELPAASAHLYYAELQRYETDDEYQARIHGDLGRSTALISAKTGVRVRSAVWPYGMYNQTLIEASQSLGMAVHFTLDDGPNTPDVPLTKIRRLLVSYDWDVGTLIGQMRSSRAYRGEHNPVERVVNVSLDELYDPDPAKSEDKLGRLLDRIKDLEPKSVYLKAFADPDGSGVARAVYFPSRHLPMRADLFNRVAWQLITRTGVQVYARMPLLSFALPADHPAAGRLVESAMDGARVPRLSPFDETARAAIREIYDDLTRYASFNGIVFGEDATLNEYEDVSAAAIDTYATWGLPRDIARIHASDALMQRWASGKTMHLTAFSRELAQRVRAYQGGGNVLTVRTLPAEAVFDADAERHFAQSLDVFVANYDFVALAAAPDRTAGAQAGREERASNSWLDSLAQTVLARPRAIGKTVFELPAVDPATGRPIASNLLRAQMKRLNAAGVVHLGYGPDNFAANQPDTAMLRDVMSVQSTLRSNQGMLG
ncbi:poly-beta-1,6-N-acetyl-D-glucosamine N-deacetylase PgaB [Paraburkholderia solisilvae]|uniref:Poly-beta-1,6-N-acetyl-D-glucosamine N-deacetylase n=1 Tax=Paraburkholderia solisilvae TaxID=624376 RepID=A0A6J5ED83_9BURK|nr:poly-beta-1,6-N-acetyl-D-glucosamine N-deacetylase PgaB [Paraburkholderia solisilvae]CAB3763025.1 Poly-beta-1,6-N-acetyl-D-glucosamine N-deacetylase [Paraburkholderia solisilvae]